MKNPDADLQDVYDRMRTEHRLAWCWACGRYERERPSWWHCRPWTIERAHIVSNPRIEDRRAVVLLCSGCHNASHHRERIVGWTLPGLTVANLLWLKYHRDRAYYDRDFLRPFSVRALPRIRQPATVFLREYASRHGRFNIA
jgi:hypothetical protein